MKRSWNIVATLLLAAGALACGSEGELSGTFVNEYQLSYDRVVIQRQESGGQPTAMVVEYLRTIPRSDPAQFEKPIKVVVPFPLEAGVSVDLVAQEGTVEHIVISGAAFPQVERGSIVFDTLGNPGQHAAGEFFAIFAGGGTLNGTFSGTVERAAF
ncbi:MAG: hypothetical protein IPL40_03510 [Proteobacteria bacterium]|nr:hypothetical protein [Pseudomonadota bacterium]